MTTTTTTTKSAEAPEMPIADRLEHCAKFTGLDAVRELLIEAAAAVRKRDAVVKLLEEELQDRALRPQAEVTDAQLNAAYLAWCKTNGTPESFARAILTLRPQQSGLTGCNCRWDGDTQVEWCEFHSAHREAIHEWAERAKTAEAKLKAMRPERVPMTDDQVWHNDALMSANCTAGFKMDALMRIVRAVETHHFGITAQAKKESA